MKTEFKPRSVYGISKLFAHQLVINYREAYNLYLSNGILFNHESPRRGETFVTKIVDFFKIIKKNQILELGNIYAKRLNNAKIMLKLFGKFYNIKKLMILSYLLQKCYVKNFVTKLQKDSD